MKELNNKIKNITPALPIGLFSPIVTELVSVPTSEHIAEIIGKLGCKIKVLQELTDTYIKTPVRGEEFIITGKAEGVAAAKQMVQVDADRITQVRRGVMLSFSPLIAKHHIKVKIPYELVGLVVGPKGATVKKIQQATNTTIVSPSRDQKDPLFYVYGQTSDSVEAAKKEIKLRCVLVIPVLLIHCHRQSFLHQRPNQIHLVASPVLCFPLTSLKKDHLIFHHYSKIQQTLK